MTMPSTSGRAEIKKAPHGINVVIDTVDAIYIGRFDKTIGSQALLHDCAVHPIEPGQDPEAFVKQTAKYGVPPEHKDLRIQTESVKRVRILGDIVR